MKPSTDWTVVRWEAVKGIANKDFTRVVALIPIAGYLIMFNDEIAGIASFDALAGVGEADSTPFLLGAWLNFAWCSLAASSCFAHS